MVWWNELQNSLHCSEIHFIHVIMEDVLAAYGICEGSVWGLGWRWLGMVTDI